jgi:hypothetical protein
MSRAAGIVTEHPKETAANIFQAKSVIVMDSRFISPAGGFHDLP